jgi:hypothetical protein
LLTPPAEDLVIKSIGTDGPLDNEIEIIVLLGRQEKNHWIRSVEELMMQLPTPPPVQPTFRLRISCGQSPFSERTQ